MNRVPLKVFIPGAERHTSAICARARTQTYNVMLRKTSNNQCTRTAYGRIPGKYARGRIFRHVILYNTDYNNLTFVGIFYNACNPRTRKLDDINGQKEYVKLFTRKYVTHVLSFMHLRSQEPAHEPVSAAGREFEYLRNQILQKFCL